MWIPVVGCRLLFRERDGRDFHHAPQDVENSWDYDAKKEKQDRIIEHPLHRWDAFARLVLRRHARPSRGKMMLKK
jgi:hypothetical protein